MSIVAATPYAKRLAKERGLRLEAITPTGRRGEIVAADVLSARASVKATPLARRKAQLMGIDIENVTGTGFGGKVFSRDLENAKTASVAPETERERMEAALLAIDDVLTKYRMTGMRKVIAQRMLKSHTEIPPVTQNIEVDVTRLLALRAEKNASVSKAQRISVNDMVLKATAITVREQERYRMQLVNDEYVLHDVVNVGMAVGMDDGLIVPVIKHCDSKTVAEISAEAKELAGKAKTNTLKPDDYGCGVITVSNIGMYGAHSFTPIINQPEAAILGVNAALDRLVMEKNGTITVHKVMMLSLTYDHRIINGTEAAAFESRMKELLEAPETLFE